MHTMTHSLESWRQKKRKKSPVKWNKMKWISLNFPLAFLFFSPRYIYIFLLLCECVLLLLCICARLCGLSIAFNLNKLSVLLGFQFEAHRTWLFSATPSGHINPKNILVFFWEIRRKSLKKGVLLEVIPQVIIYIIFPPLFNLTFPNELYAFISPEMSTWVLILTAR